MPTTHTGRIRRDVASRRRRVVVLSLAAILVAGLLVAFAPWLLGDGQLDDQTAHPAATGSPSYPRIAPGATTASRPATDRAAAGRDGRWLRILRTIDRRREAAWRRGDPALLRSVYVSTSPELREDQRLMVGYLRRGLRVSGVDLRFLDVAAQRVRSGSASLLVVDRLGAAVAIDGSGSAHPLPRDLPTRHRVELEKVGRQWRISRVELAPQAGGP